MSLIVRNWGKIVFVLVLFVCGWLVYDNWDWINANFLHSYPEVPDFYLQDYLDKYHALSEFSGRPLVINLWAADTPFSADELRDLAKIQDEFGDRLAVVAINRGEPVGFAKNFTDKLGVSSRIFILLDPKDFFYKAIGGFQMPETLFVDKGGNIVDHKRGHMKLNEMRQRIEKIL